MANNEELRKRLGNSGRIRFEENFTAEIAVHRYLDLYKELAGV
jgi:glycosyltransferase involved in cell wall biosynthesis